jgi:hypothetical protein
LCNPQLLLLLVLLLLSGYVAPGDRFKGLLTIELQVVSELVSTSYVANMFDTCC